MNTARHLTFLLIILPWGAMSLYADDVDDRIQTIRVTLAESKGKEPARDACRYLKRQGAEILPRLLAAMNTPDTVTANWYRTVYESITRRELRLEKPDLPVQALRAVASDREQQGRVRRLALLTIDRIEPAYRERLIPTLLDDPEFRDEAVEAVMKQGDEAAARKDVKQALASYRTAFENSRESGQIGRAADKLKELGEPVSVVEHMGFVVDWYVIGPFDAPGKTGFDLSFAPESDVDLKSEYDGKNNTRIRWKRYQSEDRLGLADLIRGIGPAAEAVGYAYAEFESQREQSAQIRCGADDNLTVWLNGEKVFGRLQWLNGTRLDRFTAPVHVRQGTNRLLVKVCQGPQHRNPAVGNNWSLQLRFCTVDGAGLAFKSLLPPIDKNSR